MNTLLTHLPLLLHFLRSALLFLFCEQREMARWRVSSEITVLTPSYEQNWKFKTYKYSLSKNETTQHSHSFLNNWKLNKQTSSYFRIATLPVGLIKLKIHTNAAHALSTSRNTSGTLLNPDRPWNLGKEHPALYGQTHITLWQEDHR